jgi:hypothetical protein
MNVSAAELNGSFGKLISIHYTSASGRMLPVARKNGCTSALDRCGQW